MIRINGDLSIPVVLTPEVTIFRNDTPTFQFTIKDSGTVYDLAGAVVTFAAKLSTSSTTYQFSKTCALTDPTKGICSAGLTAEDIDVAGTYIAELQIVKGGITITPLQFRLIIEADVIT